MKTACMKHKLYAVLSTYSLSISSAVSVTGSLLSGIFRDRPFLTMCNISVCTRSRTEVNQNNIWRCDLYNNSPTALLSLQITGC